MKRLKKLYLSLMMIGLSLSAVAQDSTDTWSLQRCINYAVEHNLTIKMQKLNVDRNEDMLLKQKASMLPSLGAFAQHDYQWGRTVDRFTNDFANKRVLSQNFYINSSVTLFNGFSMLNTLKERQLNLKASHMDVEKTLDDIQLSIVTAYLQVIFNRELVDVTRSQLEQINRQVEQTRKQVEAGALAKGALLNVQSQKAQEELNLVNAKNKLDIAYMDLKQFLELPGNTSFQIEIPDIEIPESPEIKKSSQQVYQYAVDNQPAIKGAQLRVKSSSKALAEARGNASPSIELQGSYGTGYSEASKEYKNPVINGFKPNGNITQNGDTVLTPDLDYDRQVIPFEEQIDNNSNYSLRFSLSVPIFNGLQHRTNIQNSKIALEKAKLQLRQEKNNMRKTIEQAHADARAALKKYHASEKTLKATRLSFENAQKKFDVGKINAVKFNDIRNKFIKAKSDLLQAKFEYLFRKKVLDFYLDKPLTIK